MARQKLGNQDIRKLQKTGNGSIFVTLPIELIRDLKWRDGQKVTVRRRGKELVIKDWS